MSPELFRTFCFFFSAAVGWCLNDIVRNVRHRWALKEFHDAWAEGVASGRVIDGLGTLPISEMSNKDEISHLVCPHCRCDLPGKQRDDRE